MEEAIKLERFDHFLVLGEWGVGKTSLLKEFKKIAQVNKILCSYISIFDDLIKARVYEYSEGHPYELQVLCSYLYDNQIQGKVTKDTWEASLNMAVNHLGDVLFDSIYGNTAVQVPWKERF